MANESDTQKDTRSMIAAIRRSGQEGRGRQERGELEATLRLEFQGLAMVSRDRGNAHPGIRFDCIAVT